MPPRLSARANGSVWVYSWTSDPCEDNERLSSREGGQPPQTCHGEDKETFPTATPSPRSLSLHPRHALRDLISVWDKETGHRMNGISM